MTENCYQLLYQGQKLNKRLLVMGYKLNLLFPSLISFVVQVESCIQIKVQRSFLGVYMEVFLMPIVTVTYSGKMALVSVSFPFICFTNL